jgi:glycosyltransferase involved in cell wall biosynthesis
MIKKNIIVCSSEYITSKNFGGLAIFLEKFLNSLKSRFNIHLVISSDKSNRIMHNNIKIYNVKVNFIVFKIIRKFSKNIFYLIQSYLLNKEIEKIIYSNPNNIEFIHFSNYQYLSLFYKKKIPIITRLSSLESLWSNNNLFSFNKILEKISLKKSQLILSPSTFLIKELKSSYNLKSYFFPPITPKFNLVKKKIKFTKKFILTFGSISPGKGTETIIKMIDKILSIKDNLYFIWIGNVDKDFYKSNEQFKYLLKGKTSHHKRIMILPKMKPSKLFSFIMKAELILLPSIRDNSPNACLESLYLKKIIIARNDSGFNDLIKNDYNGYLFSKNDKNTNLIQKLSLVTNLSKAKKIKMQKNIKKTNKNFSPEKVTEVYLKYLNKII